MIVLLGLGPTRWTVRANSLASVMNNFDVLVQTWEEAVDAVSDSEMRARIRGVATVMCTFNYVFGNLLGECLLKHADNLSSTLQHKDFLAAEGQQVARMTVDTIKKIRNDESFDLFWIKAIQRANDLGLEEPKLPRRLKRPRRYEDGQSDGDFHSDPIFLQAEVL